MTPSSVGTAVIATLSFTVGICASTPLLRAQLQVADTGAPAFDVASIRQAGPPSLTGTYDVELEAERPAGLPAPPGQSAATPGEGLSLFTAIQEQLGLKLESQRGPVDMLVIDHVERPTPD